MDSIGPVIGNKDRGSEPFTEKTNNINGSQLPDQLKPRSPQLSSLAFSSLPPSVESLTLDGEALFNLKSLGHALGVDPHSRGRGFVARWICRDGWARGLGSGACVLLRGRWYARPAGVRAALGWQKDRTAQLSLAL